MEKINSFFGYEFIKQIKLILIDEKIHIKDVGTSSSLKNKKINKKIGEITDLNLKKKLNNLLKEYENKNSK